MDGECRNREGLRSKFTRTENGPGTEDNTTTTTVKDGYSALNVKGVPEQTIKKTGWTKTVLKGSRDRFPFN